MTVRHSISQMPARYEIEQVEDDPEYWHVIDTEHDGFIIEVCSGRHDAEQICKDLNSGDLEPEDASP